MLRIADRPAAHAGAQLHKFDGNRRRRRTIATFPIHYDVRCGRLARLENRTPRSIRMTLTLAFLDPALVEAACAGTLPRGYGVTRLVDLPPIFANQWQALGLSRPI
jgi:hypothetical protein